jgi:hypothetical protein
MTNAREINLRALFDAHKRIDKAAAMRIITDDFTFSSPPDPHLDRDQYFERCWPTGEGQTIREFRFRRILFGESDAFVIFEAELTDGKKFKNTNYMVFEGDKIKHVEVYFGPYTV